MKITTGEWPALGACLVLAGLLVACSGGDRETGQSIEVTTSDEVPMASAGLVRQLEMEEGIRAIKRLQRAYGQYLGEGMWQEAAALFSEAGVLIHGEQRVEGKPGIESFLSDRYGKGQPGLEGDMLNEHLILSPVVTMQPDGMTAHGRWRLVSLQGEYGERAEWEGGIFENTYAREDGQWKLAELRFYPIYAGEYAAGWRMLKEEQPDTVEPVPYHYDAESAGVPVPPVMVVAQMTDTSLAEVGARTRRLLDEDAVISLQSAYGYYLDRMMWDDLADLFTDDATLEIGQMGRYAGRDSIRRALDQFGPSPLPANRVFDHLQLQPVVTVAADGLTASVRGTELKMLGTHEESAQWGVAVFDNRFRKEDGVWQIESVQVFDRMLSDYDAGWGQQAFPASTAADGYAADEPPSQVYSAYPDSIRPPVNFPHPVTGRQPDPVAQEVVDVSELERRLRVLNAYDGSENVSNAYGYYIDEFQWDGMADVFAVDGWKELSGIGTYVGRERVRQSVLSRYLRSGRRANSMTYHQKVQPVITVAGDGRSARIRTRLFQLNSSYANPGSFNAGVYENTIVIEDGVWKILGMDLDYTWTASVDGGWANTADRGQGRSTTTRPDLEGEQAPDRPLRGLVSAPYPSGQVDMAFHYLNPVSGRRPPVYLPEWDYESMVFDSGEE